MNSQTFCILPWMHLATNASGNLRVCCNSLPGKNFITKDNGQPYKIYKDDLIEAWNSDVYTKIREEMLNGIRPEMCTRCFREEDAGIKSSRQSWNEKWMENKIYSNTPDFKIKYVDLRLGNLCNLKCRMCNPYASNQWVKEWNLVEEALSPSEYDRLSNMSWPTEEKTWLNLFAIAETVDEIYLTGGEPTIIKEQHRLLDYFIDNNMSHKIKLKYNTNLTNIPAKLIEKWKKFKKVQLNCSIDAVGDLDRYIRFPSNWNQIQENFNQVRLLKNVNIEIHCTVQMYNILRLDEFLDWAGPYNNKIYLNILNHPEYLNIRVLPVELKYIVEKKLKKYLHFPKVQGVIDYMLAENWVDQYKNFVDYTCKIDKSRDQNFANFVPEFNLEKYV